ncbi:MAG TPA: protein kinase [Enteractinococcus helveticum]|uniref:non-specific serine/threonine protein kinase n=1 Tax=Enteractinococcus helveticum TaxID=1837282 RepID=A0A921FP34_9MICC|nr:protein kinase [Enteractinococcus helveticum]HJF14862.1 protein kinase [Enteractinococcus helveticum]
MNTPAGPSLVGLTVDNRYKITQRLAHGGMATVYRAIDTRLDREVALKILRPNMAEDPTVIEKFEAEAKNTAKINHPHVVNVYDQGVGTAGNGDVAFLTMEFIEGHTLREVMRAAGQMTVEETWNIALPIIRGVAAAHQVGLVHRDIKPENVLVSNDGDIKVADFGLARAASSHTGTGMALMGTVSYMSPELVTGEQADKRSDVYALGIMIFEMLTGQRPFSGESAVAIAVQHTNSRVPAPSTLVPGISAAVDDIVLHMTEPSPEDRPADATEVLILIQHLLENPEAAEQLAHHENDHDATQVFDDVATTAFGTAERADDSADSAGPHQPPPPPQPNVTVLPPSVTAEASPTGPMDHYQRPSVEQQAVTSPKLRDFGNKKQHEPVRAFAPIRTSRAAIYTLLIIMAAAATVLFGNWTGSAIMRLLFG